MVGGEATAAAFAADLRRRRRRRQRRGERVAFAVSPGEGAPAVAIAAAAAPQRTARRLIALDGATDSEVVRADLVAMLRLNVRRDALRPSASRSGRGLCAARWRRAPPA